ncbi:MAG: LamG domain-containing protein, partial [Planctomycetes bacterium]|nr:LamG domain-containing protein [Planctomycetota bacterium]
ADKAWWIEAAEDQNRSQFELASGIVAVADPDEWDDDERLPIPIDVDPYDTWLTTPAIDISASEAGTLELKFDSSWRPEFDDNYHQTANITASFDGGDPVEVMLWESDGASANFHPDATNETIIVNLDNPEGAKKVVLTFGLFDAGNDWWWAIDNIEVRGVVLSQDPVAPGTDGLVAYYPLDGDATDSSGNGLDGTLVGDAAFVEGQAGMAVDLDGDGDYVDCSNNELFSITDAFTLSVWINWRATGATWQTVIAKGDNAWRLARGGDTQTMDFGFTAGGDRGWQAARTASEVPLGEWHHVTATIDTIDGAKIYLDGVLEGENPDTGGITVGDYPVFIGENSQAANRFWNGLVDEVMIYDRVLSGPEIRYLAGERAKPVDPGTEGLVAFYALDGDPNDSSGNGLDGTLVGDPVFVEGKVGMALELDGVDDYVDGGSPPELVITEAISIACWVNPAQIGSEQGFASLDAGYSFKAHGEGVRFTTPGILDHSSANLTLEAGVWQHVAATFLPGQDEGLVFYLNGEETERMTSSAINTGTGPFRIGSNQWDELLTGLIDEVAIYNRILSAGEIRYLAGFRPPLVAAFAFGSRDLVSPTYNDPAVNYTMVLQTSAEAVQYDPEKGYGYEVLYPADSPYGDRGGYGVFGPFDDSPNGRNEFPDELPEELYDSFIGAKNFLDECSEAVMGDMDSPCDPPEGIIFRVDVPNGLYRFVGAVGEPDNGHAHRILAEDGGSGPPENIGANYVVLVSNHDQSQYNIGEIEGDEPGDAVFARVGFDGKIPPPGDGVVPSPVFVDMDENGLPTDAGANSPILEVTQGYIRIHQLQGNSNDSPDNTRDANGADMVILELWKID